MSRLSYYEYFKQLLAPMRLYNLDEGCGAQELKVVGGFMDKLLDDIRYTEREMTVPTAEEEGLTLYSGLLPHYPVAKTVQDLRRALAALLTIDGRSFTEEALAATIIGCGVSAEISETEMPLTVEVRFPGIRGTPNRFEELKERIEMILPCHLAVVYAIVYANWHNLEDGAASWDELEKKASSWEMLEKM